jgi:hypothetical protein
MKNFTMSALRWLEIILYERLGHDFRLNQNGKVLLLSLPEADRNICFDQLQGLFHQSNSDFSCDHWLASEEGYNAPIEDRIPAPSDCQLPAPLIELNDRGAIIHYDILGLTYWMLTRLEEVGRTDLDDHQRFPAVSSHAYQHGYLERPIVDEWLLILGQVIKQVWPNLELKKHKFSINVSHDVDSPSQYAFKSWPSICRMMASHLIKRRDVKSFFTAPYVKIFTRNRLHSVDPFNTFDWLMDISEANNIKSAFYFICGRTQPEKDADYEPESPVIRELMRRIHARGHEIGLHPSYGTFQKPELIKKEADRLKRICAKEGIDQETWGGRMHYLRWEQPTTLGAWNESGLNYDSTLGYADRPGFRCGTCHEYTAFEPIGQQLLSLRIRPLVLMECTVIGSAYLDLGTAAEDKMMLLRERCNKVGGSFNFLWHNSTFPTNNLKLIYERMVEGNGVFRKK